MDAVNKHAVYIATKGVLSGVGQIFGVKGLIPLEEIIVIPTEGGCYWENVDTEWETFDRLWNDTLPCIREIAGSIILGAPPEDAYAKAVKKDKKLHCKIVKIIMTLKGEKFEQEKEICLDDYKVTASDVDLLMEYYYEGQYGPSVTVDEITIR
jgi:hypothetical protein